MLCAMAKRFGTDVGVGGASHPGPLVNPISAVELLVTCLVNLAMCRFR